MKRTTKFSKASILGVAAVSTLFTACDLITDFIPADPNPGDPKPQISSSSNFIPTPVLSSSAILPTSSSAILPVSSNSKPSAFQTWRGIDGPQQIDTGYGTATETAGYWYSYNDQLDGGKSNIIWPVPKGDDYDSESLQPIVDYCGGICGTASLNQGNLIYQPFAGVAFDLGGEDEYGNLVAVDASNMGGVCVSYAAEAVISIEMDLGNDVNKQIDYAIPSITLPKSLGGTTRHISWADFQQPAWYKGGKKITGEGAAKQLVSLQFKIQALRTS